MREKVILICSNCLARNYVTTVNKESNKRLELMKFCKNCNKQTLHKASKQEAHIMGLKKYFAGVVKEGKRVRWPKREVLIPSIIVVVIIAAITGLLLFAEDLAGKKLIDILSDAFSNIKQEIVNYD